MRELTTKKIGILTFHRAMNYGAILQCYALQKSLGKFCGDVKVIDYTPDLFKKIYVNPGNLFSTPGIKSKIKNFGRWILFNKTINKKRKYDRLEKFIKCNIDLTKNFSKRELSLLNEEMDCFIVGSDQIWNMRLSEYDEAFFLDFVTSDKKKIAYAASLKTANDQRTEDLIQKYLPSFDAISVREQKGTNYLKKQFNIDSWCVLDPTFLLQSTEWIELIKDKYKKQQEKYILIYTVGQQEILLVNAFKYAKTHNLKIISLNHLKGRRGYKDLSDSSIEQFLGLVNDAECVFTTSFHGLALSINLHTEFYFEVSENSHNNNDRLLDITCKLGLSDRNISSGVTDRPIDWNEVESKLNVLRNDSMAFLKSAIGVDDNK